MNTKGIQKVFSEVIFLVIVVIFFIYFLPLGVDAHHDGYLFNMALNIRRGGRIYVDYHNIYGPLTAYTHALFMAVFGDTLYVMRASAVPFLVGSFYLYYHIFTRWLPHGYVIFTQILLLLIGTGFNTGWSSIYALTFILLAANAMMKYFETARFCWLVLAAVFAAITFLYRSPVGFCIILAGVCSLVYMGMIRKRKWREVIRLVLLYILSVGLTMLPMLLFLFVKGSFLGWLDGNVLILFNSNSLTGLRQESLEGVQEIISNVGNVAGNSSSVSYLIQYINRIISTPAFGKFFKLIICLFPIYPFNSQIIWVVLPIVSIITFISLFFKLIKKNNVAGSETMIGVKGLLAIYAIAAWGQYYPSGNHLHWYYSCFIMYGILMCQIWRMGNKIKNVVMANMIHIAIPLILTGQVCYFLYFAMDIQDMNAKLLGDTMLNNRIFSMQYHSVVYEGSYNYLRGIRMAPEQADFYSGIYTEVDSLLQEYPDAIVSMPYYPFNILGTFCIDTRENIGSVRIVIDGIDNAEKYLDLEPVYSQRVEYRSESYLEQNGDVINIYVIENN